MPHIEILTLNCSTSVKVLICIFYVLIIVFGLVGNFRVGRRVFRSGTSQQTVTNVFMPSLAVANILFCIFVVPILPVSMILNTPPTCSFVCYLWPCIYYSIRFGSMLTLASISLVRCWVIVYSTAQAIHKTKFTLIVTLIWWVSLMVSLPNGFFHFQIQFKDNEKKIMLCHPQWPSDSSDEYYLKTTFIVLFVVPLIAIICCFFTISFKISSTSGNCNQIADMRRTNRLILTMAVVFAVCWVPVNMYEVVPDIFGSSHRVTLYGLFYALAMSSPCLIPLFYAWLNNITLKQLFWPDNKVEVDTVDIFYEPLIAPKSSPKLSFISKS